MASPEISSHVVELWYHYEQVAMHFNELIIQYRLQLMGGLGTIGALSGYLIGGKVRNPKRRNWLRALVSTGLLMLFVGAASLDLFYYDKLLQGAVDALIEFESKNPPIDMSTLIEKRVTYRGMIPIKCTYALILLGLGWFAIWSWAVYIRTTTWSWRSIAKWGAAVVVTAFAAGIWIAFDPIQQYFASRPRAVSEYAHAALGMTKQEVLYSLGNPKFVDEDTGTNHSHFRTVMEVTDLGGGKTFFDYRYWDYGGFTVTFNAQSGRVSEVDCETLLGRACAPLLGVSAGATEDELIDHLGAASSSEIAQDLSGVKTLIYTKWGVSFLLQKRRVYGFRLGLDQGPVAMQ